MADSHMAGCHPGGGDSPASSCAEAEPEAKPASGRPSYTRSKSHNEPERTPSSILMRHSLPVLGVKATPDGNAPPLDVQARRRGFACPAVISDTVGPFLQHVSPGRGEFAR